MLKKINKMECIIISISILILVILSIIFNASLTSIMVSICGVLYTFLIGKKLKIAYFFGIINVSLYGFILLQDKIFGGAFYNLCYGLPILIYGLYYWSKCISNNDVNSFSKKQKKLFYFLYFFITILSIISLILKKDIIFTCDIFTTGFGFIGMYLLSNKYKEQWPVWIVVNLANSILWLFQTINHITNIPVFIMWILYFINSIYGYYLWKKTTI